MTPTSREQARWFAENVQPYEPQLRAYLSRNYPGLMDLDDVVQESNLSVIKAGESRCITSVKAYLFAAARNYVRQFFRRRKHLSAIRVNELPDARILDDNADVVASANAKTELALVTEAIDTLPPRCREVVVLRVLYGHSHKEIAGKLGLAEQTVRVQLSRGIKKCAQALRENGAAKELRP